MNTKTVEIKTSLNPEDRYYKPFNWLAKGLIGAGDCVSYISYGGLILANIASLIPCAIYSILTYLIFPSLTEAQKASVDNTTDQNIFVDSAVNMITESFSGNKAEQAKPMLNRLSSLECKILWTMLSNISTQEGFWAIVQAILALPFLVISFIMDVYKLVVLPAVILSSIVCSGIIYMLNHLWKQIIIAPITFFGKNESHEQITFDTTPSFPTNTSPLWFSPSSSTSAKSLYSGSNDPCEVLNAIRENKWFTKTSP